MRGPTKRGLSRDGDNWQYGGSVLFRCAGKSHNISRTAHLPSAYACGPIVFLLGFAVLQGALVFKKWVLTNKVDQNILHNALVYAVGFDATNVLRGWLDTSHLRLRSALGPQLREAISAFLVGFVVRSY